MPSDYYKKCVELDKCCELINKYYLTGDYEKCFLGHLEIAKTGYALAECQVGYFYFEGLGVKKDLNEAFYWTQRGAMHGDRDAQCNLADLFYLKGVVVPEDYEKAKEWFIKSAKQNNDYAIKRCKELGIEY